MFHMGSSFASSNESGYDEFHEFDLDGLHHISRPVFTTSATDAAQSKFQKLPYVLSENPTPQVPSSPPDPYSFTLFPQSMEEVMDEVCEGTLTQPNADTSAFFSSDNNPTLSRNCADIVLHMQQPLSSGRTYTQTDDEVWDGVANGVHVVSVRSTLPQFAIALN
jgi:hypothetical protein